MPSLHRSSSRARSLLSISGARSLLATAALVAAGCGSTQPQVLRLAANGREDRAPAGPLVVAAGDLAEGREVLVDARVPRTSLGHFRAGDRVRLRVLDGKWTYTGGGEMVGADGLRESCRAPAPHRCAAGEGVAPGMGLMLFMRPDPRPAACAPSQRLSVPTGVEFAMPQDAFVFLAPNDWEDGVDNNEGALQVEVSTAPNKASQAIARRRLDVLSTDARTPLGLLSAGAYVRVTVLGGTWTNGPGIGRVGSEGDPARKCSGGGSHVCAAGENRAPLMGLVLLMASCEDGGIPPIAAESKLFIGSRADLVVQEDGELEVGPNDWEDGCHDNAGSLRVEVGTPPAHR